MQPKKPITVDSVESIALRVFNENYLKLVGDAHRIAHDRARDFTIRAISAIAEADTEGLRRIADPAFLQSLYVAQKNSAASGDSGLESVLIELLKSLADAGARSLREICVSEAIERSGKITNEQLSILGLVFVLTQVRWSVFYRNKDFKAFVADMIEPFCISAASDQRNYSHLNSLGCLDIGPSPHQFEVFLMTHFRTLFSTGIPKEELLTKIENGAEYLSLFEQFDEDEARLRFRFQTNEDIERAATAQNLPPGWRSVFQIDARYLMGSPQKLALVTELHPAMAALHSIWTAPNSLLPRSSLTTTGIAIAHSYLASLNKAPASLQHWL